MAPNSQVLPDRRCLNKLIMTKMSKLKIEVPMRIQGKRLVLAMLSAVLLIQAFVLAPAFAQSPAIDPALLAKATGGDAPSQVLVGDAFAAGNGQARSSSQLAEDLKQAAG